MIPIAQQIEAAGVDAPIAAYRNLLDVGVLKPDPSQAYVAERLQTLHRAVAEYKPGSSNGGGWRARLGLTRRPQEPAPQGLYIFGGVGRGKSMLMDLFHQTTQVAKKRRVHFHAFMAEVHGKLHQLRKAARKDDDIQVIPSVADQIAADTWLLCFDEFHVTDITDAMILGRLFEALFERGVVVVATSNWAPDDLYKDGLQRELFLPFIAILKQQLDIIELDQGVDYRQARIQGMPVFHCPDDAAATAALDQAFDDLSRGQAPTEVTLTVSGRQLAVPRQAGAVARFTFAELCEQPLGASDYIAVAKAYPSVIVEHVPALTTDKRNEAKRLILLIDALYEARCRLMLSSAVPVDDLYPEGDHSFEFQRTLSRLQEMQGRDYLDQIREAD
ncbi:MAG: AFG1 family ATPase [Alphaproteobacteria bacterium]|nr:AFG1 family ATPase [Alphaproteobacteria bacterium SS10]